MALFYFFANRLLKFPLSKQNFKKELGIIKHIAESNSIIIDNLLKKKLKVQGSDMVYSCLKLFGHKIFCRLSYYDKISTGAGTLLRKSRITAAYFNSFTTDRMLYKKGKTQASGVYELLCLNCTAIYNGKTKRNVGIRFKEHIYNIRNNSHATGMSTHVLANNHNISLDKLKLIHKVENGGVLDGLEIKEAKILNIKNDQVDFSNNSPMYLER